MAGLRIYLINICNKFVNMFLLPVNFGLRGFNHNTNN